MKDFVKVDIYGIATMCGDLKVLEPDCEALYALHSISDIPDQEIDGSVGEETLVGQVVLLLIERERD